MPVFENVLDMIGNTPLVDVSVLSPNPDVRILAKMESQNPFGSVKDRIAKAMIETAEKDGRLLARPDDPRAVVGQHRHRPRGDRPAQGLPDQDPACPRASRSSAARCSRCSAPRSSSRRARRAPTAPCAGPGAGRRASRVVLPLPVRQRRQPAGPLRGHRSGDLARLPRDHPLRRRPRHERHADGRRPLPQGAEPGHQGDRHRAAARRAGRGAAQPRRGLHPAGVRAVERLRPARPQARRAAPRVARVDASAGARVRGVRRHLVGRGAGRCGEGGRARSTRASSSSSSATAGGSTCRPAPTPTISTPPKPPPRRSSTSDRAGQSARPPAIASRRPSPCARVDYLARTVRRLMAR